MKVLSLVLGIATFVFLSLGVLISALYPDPLGGYALFGVALLCALGWGFVRRSAVRSFLSRRSTRYNANVSFIVLLVFGILIFVNMLAKEFSWQKDLTRAGLNTLSPQTRQILRDLKQDVQVTYFNRQAAKESSEQVFKNYAHESSRIRYEFVDPVRRRLYAESFGIKADDKADVTVLTLAGTQKRIKVPGSTEEKITNGLIRLLQVKEQVVYFLEGHDEPALEGAEVAGGFARLKEELERQGVTVRPLNLVEKGSVPDDAAALVVASPRTAFFPKELDILGAWLKKNGRALFTFDLDTARDGLAVGSQQAGTLLEPYGLKPESRMLVDPLSEAAGVTAQIILGFVGAKEHPVVKDFPVSNRAANFFFPVTSYLTERAVPGFKATTLVRSSPQAWAESDWASLRSGLVKFQEGSDQRGPLALSVAIEPEAAPAREGEPPAPPAGPRIVAFATSQFANNTMVDKAGDRDLFLNAVAWLTDNQQLISIRAKESPEELNVANPVLMNLISLVTVFLLPLALVVIGIVVWRRRSRL